MSDPKEPLEGDRVDDEPSVCPYCGLRWCSCGGWTDEDYALAEEHAHAAWLPREVTS